MPMIAAFTAAEIAAATTAAEIAAAEAAAAAAAQAASTTAATTAAQTAAAEAAAASTAAAPTVGGPMAMGLPEATALAPLEAGIAGVPAAAEPAAAATRSLAFGAQPPAAAGSSAATTAGVTPPPAGIMSAPAAAPSSLGSLTTPYTAPAGPTISTGASPYQLQPASQQGLRLGTGAGGIQPSASAANAMFQPSPTAFDKFSAFADKHPFMTGAGLYLGASSLGMLDQKGASMPEKKSYGPQYRMSENFRVTEPEPNVYTPSYPQYAEGGVMSVGNPSSEVPEPRKVINPMTTVSTMADGGVPGYAKGGTLSDSLDFYKKMAEGPSGKGATAPRSEADVGIYYDQDPDTRYQDALTAAQIRQSKLNKRSNVQMPSGGAMRRPTPMGQINLAPPGTKEAAQGGIMQAGDSSLGGYAAGGSPRLLKGPGDGMSDNIPAVIGRKQPARLADGEFVIPADVVSHLGNGSTEAGAKRLHEMMNKVRRARTGNPKQGKQINPKKYMPA